MTRSPGRIGAAWRNISDSASTKAAALRWRDGHALGRAGRAGGEDDPGVVGQVGVLPHSGIRDGAGGGPHDEVRRHDRGDAGLPEDDPGPLVRVVVVDRHIGATGGQDAENCDVEIGRAAGDPHADPIATLDPDGDEGVRDVIGGVGERGIRERLSRHPFRRGLRRRHAADRRPVHQRRRRVGQRPVDPAQLPGRDPRPPGHPPRVCRVSSCTSPTTTCSPPGDSPTCSSR
jgi:hypothetical protein